MLKHFNFLLFWSGGFCQDKMEIVFFQYVITSGISVESIDLDHVGKQSDFHIDGAEKKLAFLLVCIILSISRSYNKKKREVFYELGRC